MGRPPRLPELHAVQAHPEVCEVFLAFKIPPAVEMQRLLAQHAAWCAHTGVRRRSCMRQIHLQSQPTPKLKSVHDKLGTYGYNAKWCLFREKTHTPPPEAWKDCDATSFLHATPDLFMAINVNVTLRPL
jgi:hypothetical protein